MLRIRSLFLMALAALMLGACGGSSEPDMTAASAASTGGMAKAMGTTTVGSWTVNSTNLPLLSGGTVASARAINDKGLVVGTATDAAFAIQRVIWDLTRGNAIVGQLPNYDPSSTAEPASINVSAEVAGTESISGTFSEGVYWTASRSVVGLPPLLNGSRVHITARAINGGGVVTGSSQDASGIANAVTWAPNAAPNAAPSAIVTAGEGFGISDAGHVAGVYKSGSLPRPFLWRGPNNLIDLGAVGGSGASARALAINNTGKVAGTSDGDTIAVVWSYDPLSSTSKPSLTRLPLSADLALPTVAAINDNGDVVGTAWTSNFNGTRAVLWRNGQVIPLANFNSKAFGINNAGQIVGEGDANGDGRNEAILWTVTAGTTTTPSTPVPSTTTNTAPTATIAVNTTSLKIGGTLNVAGSFKDPDQGPWNWTIDWGDGQSSSGSVAVAGTVSASHPYTVASKRGYTVVFKVTDAAGASGSASTVVKVSR